MAGNQDTELDNAALENGEGEAYSRRAVLLPGWNRRTYATWVFLAINLVVWIAMEARGGSQDQEVLLAFGAMYGPLIAGGEYWRLFTAMFLHVGALHLIFNGVGLLIFGKMAERIFGLRRFVIIYLVAGLSGSVASYAFNDVAIGAGASGAIMGILGALGAFYLVRRNTLGNMGKQNLVGLLVIAAFNLIFGFTVAGIDNWAHMGGLLGGILMGLALAPKYRAESSGLLGGQSRIVDTTSLARRWWVIPLALAVLVLGARVATSGASDVALAQAHVMEAEEYLNDQIYDKALEEIERAVELDSSSGPAFYIRGKIMVELGNTSQAITDLSASLRLGMDPESRSDAIGTLVGLRGTRR